MRGAEPFVRRVAAGASIAAMFAAAAVLHTWPLARHLSTHLPGEGIGDNASFAWNLWWMREALGAGQLDFFQTDRLIAPMGASLVLHTHTALTGWLGATVAGPLTVVEAQNVLIIAFVALNGLAAYALAREAGGTRAPSALAGVLFMLAPPLTTRLMGHFNFVAAWPFVLACWALLRLAHRPLAGAAVALGVTAAATAYAESYLFVYLVVFGAVLAVAVRRRAEFTWRPAVWTRAAWMLGGLAASSFAGAAWIQLTGGGTFALAGWPVSATRPTNLLTAGWMASIAAAVLAFGARVRLPRDDQAPGPPWGHLAGAAALTAVLLTPLLAAAWDAWISGAYVPPRHSLKTAPAGADLATLAMGPPFGPIVGPSVRAAYGHLGIDVMESSAWLGILPLALGLWAFWRLRGEPVVRPWVWVGTAAFVWSLGSSARLLGANTGLPLPHALAELVPVLNNARIPGRALIVVSLALAMLAALGLGRMRRPALVAAGLIALACLELTALPLPVARLPEPGTAVPWLASQPSGTVVHLPFGVRDGFGEHGRLDHGTLYLQTLHGHRVAGGFIARLPPATIEWYKTTEPFASFLRASSGQRVERWPSCRLALDGLRRASVRYIVVERGSAPKQAVRFLSRRLPLKRAKRDRFRTVYVLEDGAACGEVRAAIRAHVSLRGTVRLNTGREDVLSQSTQK